MDKLGIDISLPIFFVDSHYRSQDQMERRHFENETSKLWKFIENESSWQSMTKSDIEKSMRKVRKKFGEIKEKYTSMRYKHDLKWFIAGAMFSQRNNQSLMLATPRAV